MSNSSRGQRGQPTPPKRTPSKQYRNIIAAEVALEDSTVALRNADDNPVRLLRIRPRSDPPLPAPDYVTSFTYADDTRNVRRSAMENGNTDNERPTPPTKQQTSPEVLPVPEDFVDQVMDGQTGMAEAGEHGTLTVKVLNQVAIDALVERRTKKISYNLQRLVCKPSL